MRSWKASLSFSRLNFTLFHFEQWPPWSNTKFKKDHRKPRFQVRRWKNNKYNGSKKNPSANLVGRRKCMARGRWRRVEQSLAPVAVTFHYIKALCDLGWFDCSVDGQNCWVFLPVGPICTGLIMLENWIFLSRCEAANRGEEMWHVPRGRGVYKFKLLVYDTQVMYIQKQI